MRPIMDFIKDFIAELDLRSYQFALSLALLLIFAKLMGYVSQRLKQPAVLGEIVGGLLLGPSLLGWVEPSAFLTQMANIGVILLMFIAGLETNTELLRRVLRGALFVAFLGVAVPFLSGFYLGQWLGYSITPSLILGTILVATSVSITVQVLKEMGKLKTLEGTTILGAAIMDDILGFLVLSVVLSMVSLSPQSVDVSFITLLLLKVILFFVLFLIGRIIAGWLVAFLQKTRVHSLVTAGLLAIAFTFAYIAEAFGLAGMVGAYLIGLAFSSSFLKNRETSIDSLETIGYAIFIPVFFAGIGLHLDLTEMSPQLLGLSALIALVAIFSKIIGCGAGARLAGFDSMASFRIGVGMIARGEVGLIVSMTAFQSNLIGQDLFSATILVVIMTTLITPFLLGWSFHSEGTK